MSQSTAGFMSADDGTDGDGTDGDGQQRTNAEWKQLRDEQKARKTTEAALEAQKRENAFLKAGINPEDEGAPAHTALFIKGYEGELTTEAITAEAVKMNILKAPEQQPATQQATPEQQQTLKDQAEIDAAADGATPPTGGPTLTDLDKAHAASGNQGVAAELAKMGIPTVHSP